MNATRFSDYVVILNQPLGNGPCSVSVNCIHKISLQEQEIFFQYGALLQVNELEAVPCDDSDEDIDEINQQILMELESS